jgi:hypothetical protein
MVRGILAGIVFLAGSAVVASAAGKEDVQAATKKLADSANYSWTTTVEGGFGPGPTEGKTQKDGTIVLKMTFRDNSMEIVKQGDKGALKTEDGWKSFAEAAEGDGQPGPASFISRMLQTFKAPAAQAEDLAGKTKELKKTGDAYEGELTEDGAKSLLSFGPRRGGGEAPPIKNPKGSVKFMTKDGALSKYEFNVQCTINFGGEDRDINRTTTVEIKDVGSTKIELPDEAKAKLK